MSFKPQILNHGDAARAWARERQGTGLRVGFVPTMGALHAGHLSLVAAARRECDATIASVFVNPTQFAPHEDFARYPRDLEADVALLAQAGCDAVFTPTADEIYPAGFCTTVDVGPVARVLEGAARPTHFVGVATVVLKLLHLTHADLAYFGRKDYQQTVVVQRLVADLNVPCGVRVCPIVREADGLAMSSRNRYLSGEDRARAVSLSAGLRAAEALVQRGERDAGALRGAVERELSAAGVEHDYIELVADGSVTPVETLAGPSTLLVAARLGGVRLIDNAQLDPAARDPKDHGEVGPPC